MTDPIYIGDPDDAMAEVHLCRHCEIVIPAPFTICAACHEYPSRKAGTCVHCGGTAPEADALCWACAGEGQMPFPDPIFHSA